VRQQKSKGEREGARGGMKDVPMALVAVWLNEILAPMKLMATLNSRGRPRIETAALFVQQQSRCLSGAV